MLGWWCSLDPPWWCSARTVMQWSLFLACSHGVLSSVLASVKHSSGEWPGHCRKSLVAVDMCFSHCSSAVWRHIWWVLKHMFECEQISSACFEFIQLLFSPVTSSLNTTEPVLPAAVHTHTNHLRRCTADQGHSFPILLSCHHFPTCPPSANCPNDGNCRKRF